MKNAAQQNQEAVAAPERVLVQLPKAEAGADEVDGQAENHVPDQDAVEELDIIFAIVKQLISFGLKSHRRYRSVEGPAEAVAVVKGRAGAVTRTGTRVLKRRC